MTESFIFSNLFYKTSKVKQTNQTRKTEISIHPPRRFSLFWRNIEVRWRSLKDLSPSLFPRDCISEIYNPSPSPTPSRPSTMQPLLDRKPPPPKASVFRLCVSAGAVGQSEAGPGSVDRPVWRWWPQTGQNRFATPHPSPERCHPFPPQSRRRVRRQTVDKKELLRFLCVGGWFSYFSLSRYQGVFFSFCLSGCLRRVRYTIENDHWYFIKDVLNVMSL